MAGHGSHAHPAPGVTIDYFAAGSGRPLVLVHGITESRRTWDPLIAPSIAAGYRVVAVDLRGHGDSSKVPPYDLATMAADLGAVLEEERLHDALLVGHSLGGAVVSAYAAGGPCRGVVNVDQPLSLSAFQATLLQLQPMLEGDAEDFQAAITAIFDDMAGPLDGAERWRVDHIRDADQDVVLGVWNLVFRASVAELDAVVDSLAEAITVPYLSLHGIDPGPDYSPWLTTRIPSATVEIWPALGHYPHLVEPERFLARVVEFDR
jgi:pimeloyl-ACP methyl ester carboxylesterase